MDTDGHARVSLADLQASAPRSFDKQLIEILVAIQNGQKPIEAPSPTHVVAQPSPELSEALMEMAAQINDLRRKVHDLETADIRPKLDSLHASHSRLKGAIESHLEQFRRSA